MLDDQRGASMARVDLRALRWSPEGTEGHPSVHGWRYTFVRRNPWPTFWRKGFEGVAGASCHCCRLIAVFSRVCRTAVDTYQRV
jgi:hypothetical protein